MPRLVGPKTQRRGAIAVLAALLSVPLMCLLACSIDVGFIMVQRTRAQAATDAASLAAVDRLHLGVDAVGIVVDDVLTSNGFDPQTVDGLGRTVVIGEWDSEIRSFTAAADIRDANAVHVDLVHTNVASFFGRVFGVTRHTCRTQAIATRGEKPRDIVLVIDCSTSMESQMGNGRQRIDNAKIAAQALVDELVESDRVGLAVYSWTDPNRNDYEKTGIVERLLNLDKAPTSARIGELSDGEYGSGTNIGGGLRAGLDVFLHSTPRPPEEEDDLERILVLLTDGCVNTAEPYPEPNDGPTGLPPEPPYSASYDDRVAVTQWANTIKARGILIHAVTLGDSAYDELMVDAASPPDGDQQYYHHIANGQSDYQELLGVYRGIGRGDRHPRLVR